MKDIGWMHYFLALEVWKVSREIFLGKWNYALDSLRIFRMEERKLIATPMITNLNKINTSDSELVDQRIYRQLVGSLMYLVNTRLDIFFSMNTLS
jgi:hypothetical protein